MPTLFRKWWVILLQGILFIVIGFIFFNNPVKVLEVISFWIGLITIVIGTMGLVSHFASGPDEKEKKVLWWSIATLFFGLVMIFRLSLTMKIITVIFGLWVLLTGIWLTSAGWANRHKGLSGWLMLAAGIVSATAGIVVIFDLTAGAVWISTLLGIQAFLAGLGLIILALIKRQLQPNMQ